MGDRTALQVYVYDCPDAQLQAAGEVLAAVDSDGNLTHYAAVDDTLNAAGGPIRRGQEALQLAAFANRAAAEAYVAELPGAADGRYSIDEIEVVTVGGEYLATEISCGSADEYATALIKAAPGASFVLWEDPAYQWLGSLRAYAPDLGEYAAECDANGIVTLTPEEIRQAVSGATDAVQSALDPIVRLDSDAERARVAVATILAEIDRATGKPWFDRWHSAALAAAGCTAETPCAVRAATGGDCGHV